MLLIAVASSMPWIDAILPSFLVAASLTDASRHRSRSRAKNIAREGNKRYPLHSSLQPSFSYSSSSSSYSHYSPTRTDGRPDGRGRTTNDRPSVRPRPSASVVSSSNDFSPSLARLLHKRTLSQRARGSGGGGDMLRVISLAI